MRVIVLLTLFIMPFTGSTQNRMIRLKTDSLVNKINEGGDLFHFARKTDKDSCSINSRFAFEDFYLDTTTRQLIKVIHANQNLQEVKSVFYFNRNRLIKMEAYRVKNGLWQYLDGWYYDQETKSAYAPKPNFYAIHPGDFIRYERNYINFSRQIMRVVLKKL